MPQQFEPLTEERLQQNAAVNLAQGASVTTTRAQEASQAADAQWQSLLKAWQQENSGRGIYRLHVASPRSAVVITLSLFLFYGTQVYGTQAFVMPMEIRVALWGAWAVACGLLVAFSRVTTRNLTAKQLNILNELETVEDVRAIGGLLEAWNKTVQEKGRDALAKILGRLLPRLCSEDAHLLTPTQRAILYASLSHEMAVTQSDLVLACLQAIEQIGDRFALPHLGRLVVRDAPTQREQQIREHARQCLHSLTARLDFGTIQNIPDWIAKLPYYSASKEAIVLPDGADEALIAHFALIRLLPQLQPSDAALLKRGQRTTLAYSWSGMRGALHAFGSGQLSRLGAEFSNAVLDMLKKIGTGRDLGLTHRLLQEVPADELPPLRLKARDIEKVLQSRREKEQVSHTLLRGASAPDVAPNELLRAAAAEHVKTAPQELLRSAEEKE